MSEAATLGSGRSGRRAGGWAAGLRRAATAVGHALWRPLLRRRLGRVRVEEIDGVSLVVLPEVFDPKVFRSGALLARAVAGSPVAAPPRASRGVEDDGAADADERSDRALDLGTGSGVGAVFAARRGWRVVALDVNPQAVRCARVNALLNGLEERIEVREGDLFAPVAGERFDLVLFNPPYFRGEPRDELDRAWRSRDVPERFAAGLAGVLAPGGRALVVLSTDGEGEATLAALARHGFLVEPAAERAYGNEVLTAWSVVTAAAEDSARAPEREAETPGERAAAGESGGSRFGRGAG